MQDRIDRRKGGYYIIDVAEAQGSKSIGYKVKNILMTLVILPKIPWIPGN